MIVVYTAAVLPPAQGTLVRHKGGALSCVKMDCRRRDRGTR